MSHGNALNGVIAGDHERQIQRFRDGGWKELDSERAAFVFEYIQCWSYAGAAREIGKDVKFANKMRIDPVVQACINDARTIFAIERQEFEHTFRNKLLESLEKFTGDRETRFTDSDGIVHSEYIDNPAAAMKCLDLIAKTAGSIGQEQSKGSGGVQVNINFSAVDGSRVPKEVTVEASEIDG